MLSDHCPACPVCNVGVLWPNGWMDLDKTWQLHCVRWGPSSPTERGKAAPTFEIYGCRLCPRPYNPRPMSIVAKRLDGSRCHLGREVGLGPGHIELHGDPAPPKETQPSIFGPCPLCQTAEWIKMPFCTEISLSPGDIVLDGDPVPPSKKGGTAAPTFRPMSVVDKRLDRSRCHLVRR